MNPGDEKILSTLRAAIEKKPDNPRDYYNCATIYLENGDLETALAYSNKALELKPDYTEAYDLREEVYRLGRELIAREVNSQKQTSEHSPVNQTANSNKSSSELTKVDNISQRSNLQLVVGTGTEPQSLSEATRISFALAKIRQGQEELRSIIPTITEVGALYRIWKANAGLEEEIGERLKVIYPEIPQGATASFNPKTKPSGIYVSIQWTVVVEEDGKSKRKPVELHIGRDDELDPPNSWNNKEAKRNSGQKKGNSPA